MLIQDRERDRKREREAVHNLWGSNDLCVVEVNSATNAIVSRATGLTSRSTYPCFGRYIGVVEGVKPHAEALTHVLRDTLGWLKVTSHPYRDT